MQIHLLIKRKIMDDRPVGIPPLNGDQLAQTFRRWARRPDIFQQGGNALLASVEDQDRGALESAINILYQDGDYRALAIVTQLCAPLLEQRLPHLPAIHTQEHIAGVISAIEMGQRAEDMAAENQILDVGGEFARGAQQYQHAYIDTLYYTARLVLGVDQGHQLPLAPNQGFNNQRIFLAQNRANTGSLADPALLAAYAAHDPVSMCHIMSRQIGTEQDPYTPEHYIMMLDHLNEAGLNGIQVHMQSMSAKEAAQFVSPLVHMIVYNLEYTGMGLQRLGSRAETEISLVDIRANIDDTRQQVMEAVQNQDIGAVLDMARAAIRQYHAVGAGFREVVAQRLYELDMQDNTILTEESIMDATYLINASITFLMLNATHRFGREPVYQQFQQALENITHPIPFVVTDYVPGQGGEPYIYLSSPLVFPQSFIAQQDPTNEFGALMQALFSDTGQLFPLARELNTALSYAFSHLVDTHERAGKPGQQIVGFFRDKVTGNPLRDDRPQVRFEQSPEGLWRVPVVTVVRALALMDRNPHNNYDDRDLQDVYAASRRYASANPDDHFRDAIDGVLRKATGLIASGPSQNARAVAVPYEGRAVVPQGFPTPQFTVGAKPYKMPGNFAAYAEDCALMTNAFLASTHSRGSGRGYAPYDEDRAWDRGNDRHRHHPAPFARRIVDQQDNRYLPGSTVDEGPHR